MRTKTGVLTFTDLSQMQKMRRGSELGSFLDEMNVIRPEELIGELTAHFQEGSGNNSRFFMDYRYRDFASVSRVRRMMPVYGAKGLTPGITRQANFVELLLGKESDLIGNGFNENIFGISYLNGEDTVTMSDRELELEIGKVGIVRPMKVSPENMDKLARTLCRLWDAQEKDPSTRFVILTGRAGERSVEIIRQLYMLLPDRLRLQLGFETNVTGADIDRIQSAKLPIYVMTAEPGQDLARRRWAFPVVVCEWERTEQYPCDEGRLALVRKLAEAMDEDLAVAFGKAERAVLYQKQSDVSSFKYYEAMVRRLFSVDGASAGPERTVVPERKVAPVRTEKPAPRSGAGEEKFWIPDLKKELSEGKSAANDAQPWLAEPAEEKPAANEAQPWLGKPAAARPAQEKSAANDAQPWLAEPAAARPAQEKPAAEKPAANDAQPWLAEPAAAKPTEDKPAAEKPASNDAQPWPAEQAAEKTATEKPTVKDAQAASGAENKADGKPAEKANAKGGPEIMPWFKSHVSATEETKNEPRKKPADSPRPAVDTTPVDSGIVTPFAWSDPSRQADPMTHLRRQNEALTAENKKLNDENSELRAKILTMTGEEMKLKANYKVLENDKDTLGRSRSAAEREIRELTNMNRKLKRENAELAKANMALGEKIRRLEKGSRRLSEGGDPNASDLGADAAKKADAGESSGFQLSEESAEALRVRPTYEQLERRTRQLYRKNRILRKRVLLFGALSIFLFLLLVIALITLWMLTGSEKKTSGTTGPAATQTQTGTATPGNSLVAENGETTVTPGATTPGGATPTEGGESETSPAESGESQTAPVSAQPTEPTTIGTADDWTAIQGSNPGSSLTWAETSDRLGEPAGYQVHYHIRFASNADGMGISEDSSLPYIGVYVNSKPTDTDEARYYQWQPVNSLSPANGVRADWIDVAGIDYYLHIAYAADLNGTDFSTTDPTGRGCVGYYISGHADGGVSPDSSNPGDYKWVFR